MQKLLNTKGIAEYLGITEAAVRSHIARKSKAIPSPFKLGAQWRWVQQDVDAWVTDRVRIGTPRRRGRPKLVERKG
jgi:predicted DNA-binding transcriptional regulator AlpA